MTMWDTCLIDGTDVETIAHITDWSGLSQHPPTRQEVIEIPGRAGAVFVPGVFAAYSFPVPVAIVGADQGEVNEKFDALKALCDTRAAAVTLTRRRTVGVVNVSQTASCVQTGGMTPVWIGTQGLTVELMFQNLSGDWA